MVRIGINAQVLGRVTHSFDHQTSKTVDNEDERAGRFVSISSVR
jgi:hypothetical protein